MRWGNLTPPRSRISTGELMDNIDPPRSRTSTDMPFEITNGQPMPNGWRTSTTTDQSNLIVGAYPSARADQWANKRHSHPVPWRQYLCLGIWTGLLTVQYTVIRFVTRWGIPPDFHEHHDWVQVMYDIRQLYTMGFVLAIFTGVHMPGRFAYLFCFKPQRPRGLAFLAAFCISGPVWGSFDLIPQLNHFYITPDNLNPTNCTLLALIGIGFAFLVGWHLVCAWKHNSTTGFFTYLGSRLAVWLFYIVFFCVVNAEKQEYYWHIHHYLVAFLIALFAEFNHPISLLLLGIASGIFVQGIAAYDADPLIYHHHQRPFFPPSVTI